MFIIVLLQETKYEMYYLTLMQLLSFCLFFLMFFLLVVCIDFADWTCEKWNKITEYSNINIHKYTK